MALSLRFNRNLIAASHDAFMAGASFVLALYLRLADATLTHTQAYLVPGIICFMALSAVLFSSMRLYQGLWRYASMRDLVALTKAVTLAIFIFYLGMFLFNRLEGVPRSVPFIQWLLLLAMLGGPRFFYRVLKDRRFTLDNNLGAADAIPVLLIGAGDNAELFLREMMRNPQAGYRVVGLVDDDTTKIGRNIHNIRVYGNLASLPTVVRKLERKGKRPQKLIVVYDMDGSALRALFDMADELGVPLARLPKLTEFKSGLPGKLEVQPIAIEDLLGRPQNVLDREGMRRFIEGRRVLVTGAGGTIGSELVRQIASFGPRHLVLLEQSEYNLYQIDREIGQLYPAVSRSAVLADVRDEAHISRLFAHTKPELVFHAAAIKHVPIAEENVEEAVLTNVLGTQVIADACEAQGVNTMLLISTDKAVNPTSVMGATKRLAEGYCQALADAKPKGTQFITVRFGNVLGSTGSVVPLFQAQLQQGGPLTVTHPDMVRFFMTVREAVELVMQAATLGVSMPDARAHIFVLDMGQPVRILDLALQMIKLAGLKPYSDINIEFTGLRKGEKLFEELFHFSEECVKTAHSSIMRARPRAAELAALQQGLSKLKGFALKREGELALAQLCTLVPEFTPDRSEEKRVKKG